MFYLAGKHGRPPAAVGLYPSVKNRCVNKRLSSILAVSYTFNNGPSTAARLRDGVVDPCSGVWASVRVGRRARLRRGRSNSNRATHSRLEQR